jgi:MFS family permease
VVALPLALIASAIIPGIGWLTIFVAPFAGTLIAEAVRLVTRKRRGRWLPIVVSLCIIAGGLPTILGGLLGLSLTSSFLGSVIWQVVYLALAVSSAYYRIK